MTVQFLGFWKEEGYENMPSILDSINRQEVYSKKLEKRIIKYLLHAPLLNTSFNCSFCLINGCPIRSGYEMSSDGKWIWKFDLIHYEEQYKVKFPSEFIQDVQRTFWLLSTTFWIKMIWLNKLKKQQINYTVFQSSQRLTLSPNGNFFDLDAPNSPYSASIVIRLLEKTVPTKIRPFDWLMLLIKDDKPPSFCSFTAEFIVIHTFLKDEALMIQLNILALNATFMRTLIQQQFYIYKRSGGNLGLGVLESVKDKD